MKYLIDGYDKMVGSLAHQYLSLRAGDEYRLFDLDFCDIDGYDVPQCSNFLNNNENIEFEKQPDSDPRRMKVTTDFEKSLDWCDCYVNFINIPRKFAVSEDLNVTEVEIQEMLDRINLAIKKDKKIYLGNLFSKEFEQIAREYPYCINKIITKDDLKNLDYFQDSMDNYYWFKRKTKISMVIGTSSNCGKFSCASLLKKKYEDLGEKVILVHSEETYPFLDDKDGTIQGFCRNFSELSTDEDFEYIQRLTMKIASEQHPDRIIFVTQGGFCSNVHSTIGASTVFGKKMENIWDQLLINSFGVDSVAIAANWDKIDRVTEIAGYCKSLCGIEFVYLNPVTSNPYPIKMEAQNGKKHFTIFPKGTTLNVENNALALATYMPTTSMCCKYNSITDKIKEFRDSEYFNKIVLINLVGKIMSAVELSADLPDILNMLEGTAETRLSNNDKVTGYSYPKYREILGLIKTLRDNKKWI